MAKSPSSSRYCRSIRIRSAEVSVDITNGEINKYVQNAINNLKQTKICVGQEHLKHNFIFTIEVCSAVILLARPQQ